MSTEIPLALCRMQGELFLWGLSFPVFPQEVRHGFLKEIVDAPIKIDSELLNILQYRHIQACRKWLSFIHEFFISAGRSKVNK